MKTIDLAKALARIADARVENFKEQAAKLRGDSKESIDRAMQICGQVSGIFDELVRELEVDNQDANNDADDVDEYPLDIDGLGMFLDDLDASVIAEFVSQIASTVDHARGDEQGAYPALTIPHVNKSKRRAQFERSLTQLIDQWAMG